MNKGRHIGKWVKDTGLPKKRRRNIGRAVAELRRGRRLMRLRKLERLEARRRTA